MPSEKRKIQMIYIVKTDDRRGTELELRNPDLEFWSIEAIKNCVMSGLGLSFLPLITVQNELREGKLKRLAWDDRPLRLATQITYHKKKWISPALREFLLLVGQYAAEWQTD